MKDEIGYKILERLNTLIKLTALNVLKQLKFKEQVRILNSIGLKPKEIAEILGKSPANVRVVLHYLRKQKSKSQTVEKHVGMGEENEGE